MNQPSKRHCIIFMLPYNSLWCDLMYRAGCFSYLVLSLWQSLHTPSPYTQLKESIVTLMVDLFLTETFAFSSQSALCFCWRQGQLLWERVAFGELIQTKHLRERSHLKAVNNTTVMSLYKIEKSLQSGTGVFSHVTAPWSPTWCSC